MPQHPVQLPDEAEPTALSVSKPVPDVGTLVLGKSDGTMSESIVALVLDAITDNAAFKDYARAQLAIRGTRFSTYPEILGAMQTLLYQLIRGESGILGFDPFDIIEALNLYKARVSYNLEAYDTTDPRHRQAVFWPNPTRQPPSSIYETLPYAENLGLVTKETPIGSAGSCFAIGIASNLHRRGFNYVATENETEDALAGVYADGFDKDNSYARFSANYGLLFNTPSFRQLAEKAFGIRRTPRVLLPSCLGVSNGEQVEVFLDPFRENVYFFTREAYEENYEKHLAAVRDVFLKSEVFVATPGLNECWEFVPDGSVLARNPRELDIYPLVRHRVLSVEENIANLQQFLDIVRAHNPNFKLILSLSPVPFIATGLGGRCHVVTANSHSKAVLRVALEEIVRANSNVFYFPSYELVTTCTESPWEPDQRHVNEDTVARAMQLFDAMYVR